MNIGIITGTGFYDLPETKNIGQITVDTPFGNSIITEYRKDDHSLFHIARHGSSHQRLPNMINHRANIYAMKKLEVKLIIGTSVMSC